MKLHRNAKTTPISRLALVRRVQFDRWSYQAVAEGYGVSVRTVATWVQRFREARAGWKTARPVRGRRRTSPPRSA